MSKRGRLSNFHKQYIEDNAAHKTYDVIAREIGKTPEMVKDFIENKMGLKTTLAGSRPIVVDHGEIKDRDFWPSLTQELTAPELDMFVYHWNKICEQFNYDILSTEEIQIIDVIKLEILMHRNMCQQKQATLDIAEYDKRVSEIKGENFDDPEDFKKFFDLEKDVSIARQTFGTLSRQYLELQEKKNAILKALKATRLDRITRIESTKETFSSLLAELISDYEMREEFGKHLEKMRLSTIDEKIRMTAWHKYEDGGLDRPIFNSESVMLDETPRSGISESEKDSSKKG